jgi:tetratricopeptide (TPR) repeat protein
VSADRARGIDLYEKGADAEAIKALRAAVQQHADDLSAWYYLGLSLERQRKTGDARKAFEKAARLGDNILAAQFDAPRPGSPKSLRPHNRQLRQAADSAAKYIELAKPSKSKLEEWTSRAAYLHDLAELSSDSTADASLRDVFTTREVTTKPRVLAKPEAHYTEDARRHQITGTIVIRCVFAADGRVRAVYPLRSLPNGLTFESIKAAQQIKFIPALKDGNPVSVFMQVEYNFNLY